MVTVFNLNGTGYYLDHETISHDYLLRRCLLFAGD